MVVEAEGRGLFDALLPVVRGFGSVIDFDLYLLFCFGVLVGSGLLGSGVTSIDRGPNITLRDGSNRCDQARSLDSFLS